MPRRKVFGDAIDEALQRVQLQVHAAIPQKVSKAVDRKSHHGKYVREEVKEPVDRCKSWLAIFPRTIESGD